jgi:hypothetical protein
VAPDIVETPRNPHVLTSSRSYLVAESRTEVGASPQLPNFHFARPSYASSNFGADGFLSRFGYGLGDDSEDKLPLPPLPPPNRNFSRKSGSTAAQRGSSTRPFAGIWDDASLDAVEAQLDVGKDQSQSASAEATATKSTTGALPKRKSLAGLFAAAAAPTTSPDAPKSPSLASSYQGETSRGQSCLTVPAKNSTSSGVLTQKSSGVPRKPSSE